jgi:SAM-dependent methyltransferase
MSIPAAPDTVCIQPDRAEKLSLDALLPYIPKSAQSVLDCTGVLANRGTLLKAHGVPEAIGLVDTSAGTPDGDEGYDQIITGPLDFTTLPFEAGSLDCILLTHVLERLRNPDAFLKPLVDCLAPGGLVVMTVPNMQYHKTVFMLTGGRWSYGESGVMARKNLRFYTAYEIRWMLQRLGITNVRFASQVKDDESALPRDAECYVRKDNMRAGPLGDEQYNAWLTEYFLVLATRK